MSTNALRNQEAELSSQTRETAALVASALRQAAASEALVEESRRSFAQRESADRALAMPRFRAVGYQGSGDNVRVRVKNYGATIRQISAFGPEGVFIFVEPADYFDRNAEGFIGLSGTLIYPIQFDLQFIDGGNRDRVHQYLMTDARQFNEALTA